MRDMLKAIAKKVTLELIYEVVDERTADIKNDLTELKADVRAINSRFDQMQGSVSSRFDQMQASVNSRFDSLNSRIDQLHSAILNLSEKSKEK